MRVLAVDDEPLARMALAEILSQRSDIGEYEVVEDAQRALARLRERPCDVLLLDIHMPDLSGLELIERLSRQAGPMPSIVFITAYQEHAVQAFERRVVDYVLKPLVPERVHAALDVALRRSTQERSAQLLDMLQDLKLRPERAVRLAVKDKGRIVFVDIAELISAEAQGNYVLLHQRGGSYLLREPISALAQKLQPYGFIRINRSVLVNRAFVETVQSVDGGYVLRTNTGERYLATQTYRENLKTLAQFWIGKEGFDPD